MGYPTCDICNQGIGFRDDEHICNSEDIEKYIKSMDEKTRKTQGQLDNIRDSILMLIQSLPSLENEKTVVDTKWIRSIWDAAQCRDYDARTPETFLVKWLVTHRVLCEAFSLFRTEETGRKKMPVLERLEFLRRSVDEARTILGYEDESPFDVTPEDILKGI